MSGHTEHWLKSECVKLADFLSLMVWRIFTVLLSCIFCRVYGFSLRWGEIRTVYVQSVRVFHIVKYNYVRKERLVEMEELRKKKRAEREGQREVEARVFQNKPLSIS